MYNFFPIIKKIIRILVPPILISFFRYIIYYRKRKYLDNPNTLFEGDDSLFKEVVREAKTYGEYGCGKSTKWILNNTSSNVIAVDTSNVWVKVVEENIDIT